MKIMKYLMNNAVIVCPIRKKAFQNTLVNMQVEPVIWKFISFERLVISKHT